jgi:PKD repeat protein
MKRPLNLLILLTLFSFTKLYSECVLVPLSLQERVNASTLIVEGIVQSKTCHWNSDQTMIYTKNKVQISKIFKGSGLISQYTIDVITMGGVIGNKAVKAEPELELETGEIGILLLIQKNGEWVAESGPQGFIRIDKHTAESSDVFNTYSAYAIQPMIVSYTKQTIVTVNAQLTNVTINSKRAAPSISSISPTTINAGTSSVLTIKGSNFNSTIDTSSVQFKNGDDGGLSFIKALKRDYVSWSDTMIRVRVRTKAGTGKIRLVIAGNGIANSADTLKIPYAHLNVVSGDTISYETQEIGMNSSNGITWKMNKRFYDSSGARGAFIRSLERWRCGTYINWDTLGRLNHSAIKSDGVNMCAWDTSSSMPSGVLAQCFSYWSGCFNPNLQWFVNELDIRFRLKPTNTTNWNYTTGNASGTQFHFESVATHELGHGHQLRHVINSTVVMHFSIANGQTKPGLSTNDIAGGNYVITKSATSICGKNAHTKLNSNNCAIVAPASNFTLSKSVICKNESLVYTDSSLGNISAWSWNFGANASPATANTKGPHTVTYSAGGNKTVNLTITTITGNIQKNKNLLVQADSKIIPAFSYSAAEKGIVSFTNLSNNSLNAKWYFGDGDSSTAATPVHQYALSGVYPVKLITQNTCNTDDTTRNITFAYLNFGVSQSSICINEPVYYVDSSANAASWQWSFPNGTPATATGKGPHKVTYSGSGSQSAALQIGVTGSASQSYPRNSIVTVGTDTFTKASFIYGYYGKNIVGFDNQSSGSGMSYKWYFGDGDSSSLKNPIHTYTNANNKTVRLVVTGNCNTDDTTITLRDFTGIEGINSGSLFSVSPNPSKDQFKIVTAIQLPLSYTIYDVSGKAVASGETKNGENISTLNLADGIYTLKLQFGEEHAGIKLVIQH